MLLVGFSFVHASEYMDRLQKDAEKLQNDAGELDKISSSLFTVATNCMVKHQEPSDKVREWARSYNTFGIEITAEGKYTGVGDSALANEAKYVSAVEGLQQAYAKDGKPWPVQLIPSRGKRASALDAEVTKRIATVREKIKQVIAMHDTYKRACGF